MTLSFPIDKGMQQRFDKVVAKTEVIMKTKIDCDTHYFFHSVSLRPILESSNIVSEFKYIVTKNVISQKDTKDCIKEMKDILSDFNHYNRNMDRDINDLVYNFYQHYDRAYNSALAEEFDMNYFVYQGGLIEDSRDFCAAHNNKVWHRDEAADWNTWKPYMGEYPEEYIIKQKNIYDIPSYLGYPGYQPLIDAGGYNCHHSIGWISDEMAKDMRLELIRHTEPLTTAVHDAKINSELNEILKIISEKNKK